MSEWVTVAESCPTLCDPMDCSLPGSFVHGILQARLLEWVAISFSKEGHKCQLAHYPLIFFRVWFFDLWLHQGQSAAFLQEWSFVLQESSFVFLCFSGDPMVWIFPVLSVLCHISPLRVSSWLSTSVLSLRTDPCSPCLHTQPPQAAGRCKQVSHLAVYCHSAWSLWWIFFLLLHCASLWSS